MKYILGFIAALIVALAFKGLSVALKLDIDKFLQGWFCCGTMFIIARLYEAIADNDN